MLRNLNKTTAGRRILGTPDVGLLASQIISETATGDNGAGLLYNEAQANGGKQLRIHVTSSPSSGTLFVYENGSFLLAGAADGSYSIGYDWYADNVLAGSDTATVQVGPLNASTGAGTGTSTGSGVGGTATGANAGSAGAGAGTGAGSGTGGAATGASGGNAGAGTGTGTSAGSGSGGAPTGGVSGAGNVGAGTGSSTGSGAGGAAVGGGSASAPGGTGTSVGSGSDVSETHFRLSSSFRRTTKIHHGVCHV